MNVSNHRFFGVGIFLLVLVTIWGASLAGWLELPDGQLYNGMVRLVPAGSDPARVLLVETRGEQAQGSVYLEVGERLLALGAAGVVFTALPERGGEVLLQAVARDSRTMLGRRLLRSEEGLSLEPWPAEAAAKQARSGVVAFPTGAFGLYRRHWVQVVVGGETLPALERLAAEPAAGGALPTSPYLIDFSGGLQRLPQVSAERVLAGGLVAQLVRDRYVLVGPGAAVQDAHFYTPASTAPGEISLLQYQGLALDTLLRGAWVRPAGPLLKLAAVLAVALLCLFLYQHVSCRLAGGLTLLLLALYLVAAWALLSLGGYWLPVTEMVLTQLALFPLLFTRRAELESQAMEESLLGTSARLQERVFPPSIFQSQDYWAQVVALVNQSLDLNRLIFLERVPGDHRLREIKAMNCALEDIQERRRDFLRTPYSTAINQKGPIQIEQGFLSACGEGEELFLAPLSFAGEVFGFWLFGIDPVKRSGHPLFAEAVAAFAEEIGALLYQRQLWQQRHQSGQSSLTRLLLLEGEDSAHRQLRTSLALLDHRLSMLENIFDGLETATLLYDLFGRVLQVNRRMSGLLQEAGLAPFAMTALDFVCAVTGREGSEVRQLLEKVVLEHTSATLQGRLPAAPERSFLLKIRPLRAPSELSPALNGESHPFRLLGVLCEMVDVSALDGVWIKRSQLLQNYAGTLRSQLEAAASGLERWQPGGPDSGSVVAQELQRQHAAALSLLAQLQEGLSGHPDGGMARRSPVHPGRVVQQAVARVEQLAAEREIGFRIEVSESAPPLFVPEEELLEVLAAILTFLIQDGAQGSEVALRLAPEGQYHTCTLTNQGFGLPPERFEQYLFGQEATNSPEFRKLRRALRLAQRWGCVVAGESEVGRGTRMSLRLQGFI